MNAEPTPIRRALLSVSDKTGLVPFAKTLAEKGVEILSTGGTFRLLTQNDIPAIEVSEYTGSPEMMDGRVKTLHPKIHGGILARRGVDDKILKEQNILPIDLVVVNLYPFARTISEHQTQLVEAIEQIDVGGPALIRAAAKNFEHVAVVVDPVDYALIESSLESDDTISYVTRLDLAHKAFAHTTHYDSMIANYLGQQIGNTPAAFPPTLHLDFIKSSSLRYGENPHQQAAFYTEPSASDTSIAKAHVLQGKPLSYNNIVDADSALECVKSFDDARPTCVIIKHANPCGIAIGTTLTDSYLRAYKTDPTSAFGGIIAFNQSLDAHTAKVILETQFVEIIIAPDVCGDALDILASKSNVRVLKTGRWQGYPTHGFDFQRINGGLLVQEADLNYIEPSKLAIVTKAKPTASQFEDLIFSWKAVKHVKSNAIVIVTDAQTIGIGAGQTSRIYSLKIAAMKAVDQGFSVKNAVLASDAFFPFPDSILAAAELGIAAIIQPGGSMRDSEVIEAANAHGIAMVFTGIRHFKH